MFGRVVGVVYIMFVAKDADKDFRWGVMYNRATGALVR